MKIALLATLVSFSALAIPSKGDLTDGLSVKRHTKGLTSALFEGIVKLSNCSGSLVILEGQPTSNLAMVMTNGHCIQKPGGFLNPGEVWVNVPKERALRVYDANMQIKNLRATKIMYATMTGTDVALYQLDMTYAQILARYNVRPLLLADTRPLEGTKINIPSGYWDRNWSCEIDGFVHRLLEGGWTFTDAVRYDAACDTIGGTSGSPLVEAGTRTVIAINNTGNNDGQRCTLNNPCEVNEAGDVTVRHTRSYGQQTYQMYGCFDAGFKLDLTLSSCTLAKP